MDAPSLLSQCFFFLIIQFFTFSHLNLLEQQAAWLGIN